MCRFLHVDGLCTSPADMKTENHVTTWPFPPPVSPSQVHQRRQFPTRNEPGPVAATAAAAVAILLRGYFPSQNSPEKDEISERVALLYFSLAQCVPRLFATSVDLLSFVDGRCASGLFEHPAELATLFVKGNIQANFQ